MKQLFLLTLLSFVCCNNADGPLTKNYTAKHQEASIFCKENNFNTDYYFLIDLSVHPGKNRFFIYDFAFAGCDRDSRRINGRSERVVSKVGNKYGVVLE